MADDAAALDADAFELRLIQGAVPPAELWLGVDALGRPRYRLAHEYDEDRLMAAALRVTELLTFAPEPPVRIEAHCATCPWAAACQDVAQREKRLDLLYGVSRIARANLEAAGILRLEDLAARSPDELLGIKGIGPKLADFLKRVVKNAGLRVRFQIQDGATPHPEFENPEVVVKFTIGVDGTVSSAAVDSSTLGSPEVEECIVRRFARMEFPKPEGGEVTVKYPFILKQ